MFKNYDKQIGDLEKEVDDLWKFMKDLDSYFDLSRKLPERNRLAFLEKCIGAVLKHLKVEIKTHWEIDKEAFNQDPFRAKIENNYRHRVWEAIKTKKPKSKG